MVEVVQPREILSSIADHVGMHIGKNRGLYAGGMNLLQPLHHRRIWMGPNLNVTMKQMFEWLRRYLHIDIFCQPRPISPGGKIAAVIKASIPLPKLAE